MRLNLGDRATLYSQLWCHQLFHLRHQVRIAAVITPTLKDSIDDGLRDSLRVTLNVTAWNNR